MSHEVREPCAKYLAKPAYKQTEVGVIPEDWRVATLREISPKQSVGLVINPSSYFEKNGSVPMLVGSSIGPNRINWESANRITEESNKQIAASRLSVGDLVTVRVGEPGITAVIPPDLDGCNCASVMIVRRGPTFDSHWLCYTMNSPMGISQIENVQYGTAQKQFNIGDAVNFVYPFPPLHEQQAIAAALSDADALIESLEQLLAKKRQIKQGAMQELLTGQMRLPRFAGEWEMRRLEQLADIRSGGTPSTLRSEFWDGDVLWCTPTDITALNAHKYLRDTSRRITALGLKASSAEIIPPRSVVMTSRATIGECAINLVPLSTNQGFKNFIPFDDVDVEFLYYLLTTQKQGFISLCGGSTFLEIGKTQLAAYEVAIPSGKTEQTAIATVLSDMDAEIAALEAKLAKARDLKQGMMQELLTGRIRLVQPKAEVIPFPARVDTASEKGRPHNQQIEEAVALGVFAKAFGSELHPLARVRRTKLLYLLHRHVEGAAEGYLKKAAGPYNPKTRYQGPERIALKNGYVRALHNGTYEGFVAGDKITEAEAYFDKWHEPAVRLWLEQFHYTKTEELELLATVDMAMEDLRRESHPVDLAAVKRIIQSDTEWQAKLDRPIFSDANLERAIAKCHNLFGN